MVFTEKRIRRARNLLICMLIICITPLCERVRTLSGADSKNDWFTGKELVCAIDLGDDMRGAHGLETGFSYELLKQFATPYLQFSLDEMLGVIYALAKHIADGQELWHSVVDDTTVGRDADFAIGKSVKCIYRLIA